MSNLKIKLVLEGFLSRIKQLKPESRSPFLSGSVSGPTISSVIDISTRISEQQQESKSHITQMTNLTLRNRRTILGIDYVSTKCLSIIITRLIGNLCCRCG